jgi:hypothetical protein
MKCRARIVGSAESYDQAFGTEQAWGAMTLTNAETRYESGELGTALTPAGSQSDNCDIEIELERDPTDGSDTLDSNFLLASVRVFMTLDAANDA